ncbi:hypothetical protein PRZ48_003492 [Zasmidium cellare]|uniref:Serine carboxypeptidase n=1 Tax=Zasmidium cellare TaxID=395010 RepID=A0ABR0EVU9_ZASCE|nr:hypothetical protein PRZ48_003492 [Zasmidium cellare]
MPVDHFNSGNNATYENRFWVDSTYYQPGGPVVLFNNGESGVGADTLSTYLGSNSANMEIAKNFNGMAVVFEHRYYGESIPVPVDNKTGYALNEGDYKYLTTEQALEDMVFLANNFQPKNWVDAWERLDPSTTPWIIIGASYPGLLAVFARIRNPEVFYASWASSAPVETVNAMPTYYEQIYKDMTRNCSADIAAASRYLDSVLINGTRDEGSLAKFVSELATTGVGRLHETLDSSESDLNASISKAASYSEHYAALNVADIVRSSSFQSDGFAASQTVDYCDLMQQWDPAGFLNASTSSQKLHALFGPESNASHIDPIDQGLASRYGDEAAFGAVIYATALHTQFSNFFNQPSSGYVVDVPSWNWQHCFENPNWMIASETSPYNLLSSFITVENSWIAQCGANSSFPFPIPPSNLTANNQFGGFEKMQPSNVIFIDGMKDPWHTLSVHSTSSEIGAPNRSSTQEVPACNEPPAGDDVFGMLFQDGYHGGDLDHTMAQKRTSTEAGIIPVRTRAPEPKRSRLSPSAKIPSDSSDVSCSVSEASALQSTPEGSNTIRQSSPSSVSADDEESSDSDGSDTPSDDSSSEDEDEDESEDEIVTLGGPKKPAIDPKRVLEEAHKLYARLQEIMPKLRQANSNLAENAGALNIENVKDGERHIEMNLGLGVLEEQQDSDEEEPVIKESLDGQDDVAQEPKSRPDAMQSLMGADQNSVRPSIEEVAGD